jgi:CRISPR/Cas system-associated protein Cas5 (RAMP superfamily)
MKTDIEKLKAAYEATLDIYIQAVDELFVCEITPLLLELSKRYPHRRIEYIDGMGTRMVKITPKSRNNLAYYNTSIDWQSGYIEEDGTCNLPANHPISKIRQCLKYAYYLDGNCISIGDLHFKAGIQLNKA